LNTSFYEKLLVFKTQVQYRGRRLEREYGKTQSGDVSKVMVINGERAI